MFFFLHTRLNLLKKKKISNSFTFYLTYLLLFNELLVTLVTKRKKMQLERLSVRDSADQSVRFQNTTRNSKETSPNQKRQATQPPSNADLKKQPP